MPEFHIRQALKKSPYELFSRIGFSGDHSRTIELVQSGAYELGAVNFKVWERELKAGKIDQNIVKVIWATPAYPDYQWSIRGDADEKYGKGFTQRMQNALLAMTDKDLLASFPRQSFVKANNTDYESIEAVARALSLID